MNVSNATKQAFLSDGIHKTVQIYFPELDLTITNNQIDKETLKVKESLISGSKFEIVGCIASVLTVNVYNVEQTIKGKRIEVSIQAGETEVIPLFKGVVDSCIRQSDRRIRSITAYDRLYSLSDIDVSEWYNSLNFSITMKNLRKSLFQYISRYHFTLEQEYAELPNDSIVILKQYDPHEMNALEIIKNICQFNGAFGKINREGKFEYILAKEPAPPTDNAYPSLSTYPSSTLYPTDGSSVAITSEETVGESILFNFYKDCAYEDFVVNPIDKVTIRESQNDIGISYGEGDNNYIIQGNVFAYKLTETQMEVATRNIYNCLNEFTYTPFDANLIGAPYLECGKDSVTLSVIDYDVESEIRVKKSFFILERELSGVQLLTDHFKAEGEENQRIFITDLGTSIDKKVSDMEDEISDLDDRVSALEEGGGGDFNIESVAEVPTDPSPNTIYVVRGVVIIE